MTKLRRREFMAATLGTLAAGQPLLGHHTPTQLLQATPDEFSKQIGTKFFLRDDHGSVDFITLISATSGRHQMPAGFRQPISLLFRAHRGNLRQDVYDVVHAQFGAARLLVVPVDPHGETLEIVIA